MGPHRRPDPAPRATAASQPGMAAHGAPRASGAARPMPARAMAARPMPARPMPARAMAGRRGWIAAGVLVVTAVGGVVWHLERPHLAQGDVVAAGPVRLAVAAGQPPQTFPLPDGSQVTLAPGSSLTGVVARDSAAATRFPTPPALRLTGEAFFTVATADEPLVVQTAGVWVVDRGSAFVVRAIPGAEEGRARVLVAVTEGAVRVGTEAWEREVPKREAIAVDRLGAYESLGADAVPRSVAWTSGALLFADEPVTSVLERLARWTGVSLAVDPALRDRRLSVAIEGEATETTVALVAAALGAHAEPCGSGWVLRPRQ